MISWSRLPFFVNDLDDKISNVESEIADISTELEGKQDKLTAGTNITITEDNVISATGGSGADVSMVDTGDYVKLTVDELEEQLVKASTYATNKASTDASISGLSSSVSRAISDLRGGITSLGTRVGTLEEDVSEIYGSGMFEYTYYFLDAKLPKEIDIDDYMFVRRNTDGTTLDLIVSTAPFYHTSNDYIYPTQTSGVQKWYRKAANSNEWVYYTQYPYDETWGLSGRPFQASNSIIYEGSTSSGVIYANKTDYTTTHTVKDYALASDLEETNAKLNAIGSEYSKSFDAKLFVSGAANNVGYVTLNKGRYLMVATLYYATNTTGRRVVKVSTTANDTSTSRRGYDAINPVAGTQTCAKVTTIMNITDDNTNVYINGAQNSGSQLSTSGLIEVVRLA